MRNIRGLLAVCLLFCVLLTGCQIGDKSIVVLKPLSNRYVFQIGEVSCGVKEAKLYLANYQNIYGEAYTLDLRGHDICDALERITLETLTPIEAMNELYRLKKMLN